MKQHFEGSAITHTSTQHPRREVVQPLLVWAKQAFVAWETSHGMGSVERASCFGAQLLDHVRVRSIQP